MTPPEEIDDDGDEYRLANWDDGKPVEHSPVVPVDRPAAVESETEEEEKSPKPRRRPTLPPRPFLDGTFSFPFSANARGYAVILALWSGGVSYLAAMAVGLGGAESVPGWLSCALLGAMTLMLALAWFVFASAAALAVTRDTAAGCDAIGGWPGFDVFQYLGEPLYLFNSLCVGVLPGVLVGSVLAIVGVPPGIVASLSAFFFFPIVLLSLLETGSPWGVASGPVWHTLWHVGRGWLEFYLASAMLFTAAGVVAIAATRVGGIATIVLVAILETAVWLIYFRLLGRLAWYCADRIEAETPEEDAADLVELDLIDEKTDDPKSMSSEP